MGIKFGGDRGMYRDTGIRDETAAQTPSISGGPAPSQHIAGIFRRWSIFTISRTHAHSRPAYFAGLILAICWSSAKTAKIGSLRNFRISRPKSPHSYVLISYTRATRPRLCLWPRAQHGDLAPDLIEPF